MKTLPLDKELEIIIPCEGFELKGNLHLPKNAKGLVLFAHGSGSSRFSTRNQFVARFLQKNHLGTLLFDLLTEAEEKIDEKTREFRFNLELLASRLQQTSAWLLQQEGLEKTALGYFGASTGGGAAIIAAALAPEKIKAVVSRGGRPDLAYQALSQIKAPTLLIVGGNDPEVLELNKTALTHIQAIKELAVVPKATHLFEEPGALEAVAHLAENWFSRYLK
jgi:putative phosphoribosyl transferase